jgi:hypothetical protein
MRCPAVAPTGGRRMTLACEYVVRMRCPRGRMTCRRWSWRPLRNASGGGRRDRPSVCGRLRRAYGAAVRGVARRRSRQGRRPGFLREVRTRSLARRAIAVRRSRARTRVGEVPGDSVVRGRDLRLRRHIPLSERPGPALRPAGQRFREARTRRSPAAMRRSPRWGCWISTSMVPTSGLRRNCCRPARCPMM